MIYPKKKDRKKRMRHPKSILQPESDKTCYLCALLHENYREYKVRHKHHVFGGTANRELSERYGLTVELCADHHEYGPEAAHRNQEVADLLHRIGQEEFGKAYPELDFREIFGKSYI